MLRKIKVLVRELMFRVLSKSICVGVIIRRR